jgi:thiaminase
MDTGRLAGTVGTQSTSQRLRREHEGAYARAVQHPLVHGVADGTLPDEGFDRLLAINSFFLRTYRRFLQVMGTLAPDPRSSALLFEGLRGVDVELGHGKAYAAANGVDLDVSPSPRSMDYASYVMASVGEGWARGLTVAFACETAFHEAWRNVAASVPAESPRAVFVLAWGPDSDRFVEGLVAQVDKLTWTPELSRAVGHVLGLEVANWDEALDGLAGQAEPG